MCASVFLLAGCTAAVDTPAVSEDDVVIRPVDSVKAGTIQVVSSTFIPPGAKVGQGRVFVNTTDLRWGSEKKIDDIFGPLNPGPYRVKLDVRGERGYLTSPVVPEVKVNANVGAQLPTGLLGLDFDVSKTWGLALQGLEDRMGGTRFVKDSKAQASAPDEWFPVLTGLHRISFGLYDGVEVTVGANQAKRVDLGGTTQRRTVRIVAPKRELPDDVCGMQGRNGAYLFGGRELGSNGTDFRPPGESRNGETVLASEQAIEIGMAPWITDREYVLYNPAINDVAVLPLSAKGNAPAVFQVGRIDVADVEVTVGNSVQTVKGNYMLYKLDGGGQHVGPGTYWCKTGTGADVLPGTYEVVVVYEVPVNGSKSQKFVVSVP
jgi:hypothetical protein